MAGEQKMTRMALTAMVVGGMVGAGIFSLPRTFANATGPLGDDALSGSQKRLQEFTVQRGRVESLREFARLARLRFDKGVSGYLEVLVAENELFAAELASVSLQAASYAQVVNVYQAMGGGWVDIAAQMAPQPQGLVAAQGKP